MSSSDIADALNASFDSVEEADDQVHEVLTAD